MWCDNFWLSNLSQVIVDALSSDLQYTYGVILPLCKQHLLIFKHKTHFSNIYSYTNIKARTVLSHCGIINVGTQPLTLENNNITLVVCGRLWNKTNSHYSIQTDQTCNTHALVESKPLLLRYTKLMILQSITQLSNLDPPFLAIPTPIHSYSSSYKLLYGTKIR